MHPSRLDDLPAANALQLDASFPVTSERTLLMGRISDLTQLLAIKEVEAEKRLGSVEYELDQCVRTNQAKCEQYEHRLAVRAEEVRQLQLQLGQSNDALEQQKSLVEQMRSKVNQLESYLSRLPTVEEYDSTVRQLTSSERRVAELEERVKQTQNDLDKCEEQLSETTLKVKRGSEREVMLQSQLDGAMQRLGFKTSSIDRVTPEFIEDLKFERDHLKTAFEQTKKLLEAETHRAEAAEARQRMDKRQFQEQVAREEATVAGLRTALSDHMTEIEQLRETISQLHADKQDLTSALLSTREQLLKATSMWKSAVGRKRLRLSRDLRDAVQDLTSLADHMQRIASGEKLDLASLLSQPTATVWHSDFEVDSTNEVKDSEVWTDPFYLPKLPSTFSDGLTEADCDSLSYMVREARKTVGELRQTLIDRYADQLGNKLDCLIQ